MEILKIDSDDNITVSIEIMKQMNLLNIEKQKLADMEKQFKSAMKDAMEKTNCKTFENDFIKATYIPETEKTIADTDKMKDQGIYDEFSKTSKVSSSIRITYKNKVDVPTNNMFEVENGKH